MSIDLQITFFCNFHLNLVVLRFFQKDFSKGFSFLVKIRLQTVYSIFLLFMGFYQQNVDLIFSPSNYLLYHQTSKGLIETFVWHIWHLSFEISSALCVGQGEMYGVSIWWEMGEIYFCLQLGHHLNHYGAAVKWVQK